MRFFHKKTREPKEEEQKELLKKIYQLGVDVGYFSHSEIGWVYREYTKLQIEAQKLNIEHLAKTYYEKGKKAGIERKKHDISTELGKCLEEDDTLQKTPTKQATNAPDDKEPTPLLPGEKPHLSEIPRILGKIKTTTLPRILTKITPYNRR